MTQKDGKMRGTLFQAAKQVLLMELHEYIHKERTTAAINEVKELTWHKKEKKREKNNGHVYKSRPTIIPCYM